MANVASPTVRTIRHAKPFVRRFVVCGSMAFAMQMDRICSRLSELGVPALAPDDVDLAADFSDQRQYEMFKRTVSKAHISKVRDPRTIGIIVANFQKHGMRSYIGPNTFAEIAVAFADSKAIFLMDGTPNNFADELSAWGVHDLKGNLEPLVGKYRELCQRDVNQLSLPWS